MEILQEIGAYAGMAAVVGLAVLSALYFSQARDVKRLREWAGRAPERSEQVTAQRVVAQPQPKAAAKAQPAPAPQQAAKPAAKPSAPGARPAPAPAAAGAAPATAATAAAAPAAATPAAQNKQGEGAAGVPVAAPAQAAAGAKTDTEAGSAEGAPPTGDQAAPPTPAGAPTVGAPAASGTAAKKPDEAPAKTPSPPPVPPAATPAAKAGAVPVPGQKAAQQGRSGPGRVLRRPGAQRPAPSQTAILPPPGEAPEPWYRRLLASPGQLVLSIVGVLVVGGLLAFGVVQLTKEDEPAPPQPSARSGEEGSGGGERPEPKAAPVVPANVTVSVLNGTTVPGLAAQIGDKIEGFGFQLGNITNSTDQQKAESIVLYSRGAEREAAAVGRRLRVAQREPIDPESQALGGDATVVVIAGADQTQ